MDGRSFYSNLIPRAVLQGVSKEVSSLLNFIFDLQRFDDEPAANGESGTKDNPYIVTTADDLKSKIAAVTSGQTIYIKLGDNITSTSYPSIPAGATVNLDLNGYTITGSGSYGFYVKGTLNLNDTSRGKTGGITHTGSYATIYVTSTGTFKMDGGLISGKKANIGGTSTNVTINGGRFKSELSTSEATVLGKVAENTTKNYLDDVLYVGYEESYFSDFKKVEIDGTTKYYSDNTITAADIAVAQIGDDESAKYFTSLQTALDSTETGTVKLLKDIKPTASINVTSSKTLDLNGHNITKDGTYVFYVKNSSTLTLTDSTSNQGTIKGTDYVISVGSSTTDTGTLVMNGGKVEATSSNGYGVYVRNGSTATVSGGTITANKTGGTGIYALTGSKTNVTGGTITGATAVSAFDNESTTCTVSGITDGTSSSSVYSLYINGEKKFYINEEKMNAALATVCFVEGTNADVKQNKYFTTLTKVNSYCSENATVKLIKFAKRFRRRMAPLARALHLT